MAREWVNDPPSEKQVNRVREIERLFKIKYTGPMKKGPVGAFIGQHRDNFFEMEHEEIDNESLLRFMEDE